MGDGDGDTASDVVEVPRDESGGAFLIAGTFVSPESPSSLVRLLALDPAGEPLWSRTYALGERPTVEALVPTRDGGYAVAGTGDDRAFLLEVDGAGDERGLAWLEVGTAATALQQTPDGGFVMVGSRVADASSGPVAETEPLLVTVDDRGRETFRRAFPEHPGGSARSVEVTPDGALLVGGFRLDDAGRREGFVAKIVLPGSAARRSSRPWRATLVGS